MGTLEIKIVTRTIKINGHQKNRIESILLIVGLALNKKHFLGQAVGGVGFLRVTIPQIYFLKWNRRVLWVTTDCSEGHKFLNFMQVRFMDKLDSHDCVIIKEFSGVFEISSDATDNSGEVNDDVGLLLIKHPADIP
jgi:hypothetical protein